MELSKKSLMTTKFYIERGKQLNINLKLFYTVVTYFKYLNYVDQVVFTKDFSNNFLTDFPSTFCLVFLNNKLFFT